MKQHRQRKCRHCGELFRPDPRNLRHQHYCGKPECRKASKAASQRRWLAKAQNRDYFRGAAHVGRVRAWRAAHPGYRHHRGALSTTALQDDSSAQATETDRKSSTLSALALQDLLRQQPIVLIGLIANLTGAVLQEAMPHAA